MNDKTYWVTRVVTYSTKIVAASAEEAETKAWELAQEPDGFVDNTVWGISTDDINEVDENDCIDDDMLEGDRENDLTSD
jgi:hypothetical protein